MKDYSINITTHDLIDGNLKVDSCIRADKIYTISQNIVIKSFETVNENIMEQVKNKISELIE